MQTDKEYVTERSLVGLHSESSGEYPLPDYNGDVKRVLMINPRVVPTGKFINEGSVEFSGTVFYDVVYLDSENNVSHAEFSTDYDLAVKADSELYEDSYVTTSLSSYNVRLTGPRKFSAKCSLSSDVRIMERRVLEVGGDAFDGREPETLTAAASIIKPIFAVGKESEVKEEILMLEGAIEDEVSVLLSDVRAGTPVLSCDQSGADIKADLDVTLVYKNDTAPVLTKTVRVPYTGRVDAEGLDSCASLFGNVTVGGLKTETVPSEEGVSVVATFSATPGVRGLKNDSLELIGDAYLKECSTSNEYSDFSYTEHICTESAESDFSARLPLTDVTDAPITGVAYVNSVVRVDECELEENGARIRGEIRFSGIGTEEDFEGNINYTNLRITLPFEEYVNINCQIHDNMRLECHIDTFDEKIEIADGHAVASCSLSILLTLNSQRKQRCLGASYLGDEVYENDGSTITVYYPDEKESVFDIAKKFHTSVRCIAEDNAFTQSVFASSSSPLKSFGYKKILIK